MALVVALGAARPARAQGAGTSGQRGPVTPHAAVSLGAGRTDATVAARRAPAWAPIASLVLPGAGQLAMRQPRGAAYFGLEIYEWIQLLESTRDAHRQRDEYRRIAREVARRGVDGPRPDGSWPYYEAMEEYVESGRFDLGGAAGIVPEPDETTFNGALWRKAREIYWIDADAPPPRTDATYQRALDLYTEQAVRDEFAWTWRNAEISRTDYKNTIAHYNLTTSDIRTTLGIILANHLVSGIDAFAAVRIRRARDAAGAQRIDVSVPLEVFGPRGRRRR